MARKVGQIIARGDRRWLIRVYLGRDRETNKRNYHNHPRAHAGSASILNQEAAGTRLGPRFGRSKDHPQRISRPMDSDGREAQSTREGLPGLRRHAATVRPAQPGRKSTRSNAASGFADHVSANDRTWAFRSNCSLHARSAEVCAAAGCAVAAIARKPSRWPQAAAAAERRNPSVSFGAGADLSAIGTRYPLWPSARACFNNRHASQ
jgi:hypothetical protein